MEGVFESLFLEMSLPSRRKVIIGEINRSPSGSVSSFMDMLSDILQLLEKQNHLVFMGDFNINLVHPLTRSTKDLLTLTSRYTLCPSIIIPRRVTENTLSLIDNIFSYPLSASVIVSDMSDHFPLFTVFKTSKVARSLSRIIEDVPIIDLREENLISLNDDLEKITWDSVLEKKI